MACPAPAALSLGSKRSRSRQRAVAVLPAGLWSMGAGNKGLQLAPSVHPRLHGNEQGKLNTHTETGSQSLRRAGAGSCRDGPCGLPALWCPAAPGSPYSRGTCGVCTAQQQHAVREVRSKAHAVPFFPSTEPTLGSAPRLSLPPAPASLCEQFSRAGTHAALVSPLPWTCTTPSHQTRTPPSLITAFTIFFLQTSKGQAFAWLLRKSQPQPALPGFAHQRPKSWSWRIQPELQQPRRISSLSLAPGLAASEVGLSRLGGLGETEQLCTCPQLMSDLFRRKSGLSGMKELELAA